MLYFSLPNGVENINANMFIQHLAMTRPNLFQEKVAITGCNGTIPYLSWSGGANSNSGYGLLYPMLLELSNGLTMPFRINIANVLLEDYDFYDSLGQSVLSIFDNGSNLLEVSSIPFMEKIKEKYPNYYFTLSKQADLIHEFTPEILNTIIDSGNFKLIGVPDKYNDDIEWLSAINKRSLLEITVNPLCDAKKCNCSDACLLTEHQNQIDYSCAQPRLSCKKINNLYTLENIPSLGDLKRKYGKLGINHFTFTNTYMFNEEVIIQFYIDYFIKNEHKAMVLNLWRNSRNEQQQQ